MIQVFDSWAGHLEPEEFDEWAAPYQKRVVAAIKERRPQVPVIIYMAPDTHSREGQLLERLAASGADVISVDHTVDISVAKEQLAAYTEQLMTLQTSEALLKAELLSLKDTMGNVVSEAMPAKT